jgi:hypothetical protein
VTCAAHRSHTPHIAKPQTHHVVPTSWGGPNVSENRVTLCPTGHTNVHALLDLYVKASGAPAWDAVRHFGPGERVLAERAWQEYLADPAAIRPVLTS